VSDPQAAAPTNQRRQHRSPPTAPTPRPANSQKKNSHARAQLPSINGTFRGPHQAAFSRWHHLRPAHRASTPPWDRLAQKIDPRPPATLIHPQSPDHHALSRLGIDGTNHRTHHANNHGSHASVESTTAGSMAGEVAELTHGATGPRQPRSMIGIPGTRPLPAYPHKYRPTGPGVRLPEPSSAPAKAFPHTRRLPRRAKGSVGEQSQRKGGNSMARAVGQLQLQAQPVPAPCGQCVSVAGALAG